MKIISVFILAACLLCSGGISAQKITNDKVPPAVGKAFRTKFPAASQDSWAMAKADVFSVVFFNNRKRQSAQFDNTGKWLETESEADVNQLPRPVSQSLNKQFGGFQVQEVYIVETADKGTIYRVSVFKGKENYEVTFSTKGDVLSKEAGKEDEE